MGGVFNSIGEGVANLFGAGPQGGPLGGFKPFAQGVDDLAAGALAPETGGLSLAVPGAFAAEDAAKGNVLGAVGNLAAVGGGAYNAGLIGGGGAAAGGAGSAAGAAAPAAAAGGSATAPGDFSAAFQPGDLFSGGTGPGATAIGTGASGIDPVAAGFETGNAGGADTGSLAGGTGAGTGASTGTGAGGIGADFIPSAGLTPLSTQLATASPAAGGGDFLAAPTITGGSNPTGAIGATGGTAGAAAGPGGASAAPGFIDSISNFATNPSLSAAGGIAKSIPAGAYIGAAGLGYEALKGNPPIPNLSTLNNIAGQAESNSQSLINAELSGQLPPGAAARVQQGLEGAQAEIRSQFAGMGLTGSSAETDALANASQQASAQSFQIASQMAQQGISLAGLPASIYEAITQQVLGEDQQFQNAIVQFASAAGGAGPRIQIGGNAP